MRWRAARVKSGRRAPTLVGTVRLLPALSSSAALVRTWPARARARGLLRLPDVLVPAHTPRTSVTRRRLGAVLIAGALGSFAVGGLGGVAVPNGGWNVATAPALSALGLAAAEGVVLGVLLGLAWRHRASVLRAASLGVVSGATLATAGAWATGVLDLASAVVTAAACVAAARLAQHSVRQRHDGRDSAVRGVVCAADYPLVGAVALCTPVVWLASALGGPGVWAAVPLAAFGGALLATVRVSRGPAARGGVLATCALVAGWAAVVTAPLAAADLSTGVAAVAIAVGTGVAVGARLRTRVSDRRFEQRAIGIAVPAFVAAGSALVVTAPANAGGTWLGAYLGLALVAGYVGAEARGRTEWAARVAWRRLAPGTAAAAVLAEVARAVATEDDARPWRAVAAFAAARVGATLYHAHRAHVRALRLAGVAPGVEGVANVSDDDGGYIRRPWQPPPAACSTRARWTARSSAWPTRSSN